MAQGLLNNVSLHTLNLAWNGLEDAGCTAIAQTLHQNMGLQVCIPGPPLRPTACLKGRLLWPGKVAALLPLSQVAMASSTDV